MKNYLMFHKIILFQFLGTLELHSHEKDSEEMFILAKLGKTKNIHKIHDHDSKHDTSNHRRLSSPLIGSPVQIPLSPQVSFKY